VLDTDFTCPDIGEVIWLRVTISEGLVPSDATILYGSPTTPWPDAPDPVVFDETDPDNVFQKEFHQIIAEVVDATTDPRPGLAVSETKKVVQLANTNFVLKTQAPLGVLALIMEPYHAKPLNL